MTKTLAIDCGGTGIKGSVLDSAGQMLADKVRVRTPYPLPPERFVGIIGKLASRLPTADRATVGMPGMIRHGRVVSTPHYITVQGPHSEVLPEQEAAWRGFDVRAELAAELGMPTVVLNDAEVAAAGAITGRGFEVLFTLGTGLGCAIFDDGRLLPHIEVSRSPVRRGRIYGECGEDDHATRMMRMDRRKLIYYPVGNHFQLFDLEADPQETRDLAGNAAHGESLAELTASLIAELHGSDLDWLCDGVLNGKPDRPYNWASHRSLNSQRGDGWPPGPAVDIPQIEWTRERDAGWPANQ